MSKLLSIALKDILNYSHRQQWDNMSPRPEDTTLGSYQNVLENKKSDESYEYCSILTSDPWKEFIKDPFNEDKMKAYLAHNAVE